MLTKDQAEALAQLAHLLRADLSNRTGCSSWDVAGILKQLREVARFPAEDVALAVIRAAVDQGAATPGVIPSPEGPHWKERLSERRAVRNPMPHEECPEHPGQYRLSCSFRAPCGPPKVTRIHPERAEPPPDLADVRAKLKADQEAYQAQVRAKSEELRAVRKDDA